MLIGHAEPWACHVSRFRILDAQMTAMPDGGEMTVEAGVTLLVTEGRQEASREDDDGRPAPSALEYFCRITLAGADEPQAWSGQEARIVVSGNHENGSRITIAGTGAFGRDDNGHLEVEFATVPEMKVVATGAIARPGAA